MKPLVPILLLLFAVLAVGCAQQAIEDNTTDGVANRTGAAAPITGQVTGDDAAPQGSTPDPLAAAGDLVEINMTAQDFAFAPNVIRAQRGDRVRINIVDSDDDHGIGIQGYTEYITFGPGNEGKSLEFTADKTGNFTFYCNVPCGTGHRNMTGVLVVE